MKILHLSTDNKFISFALDSFETVYPDCNHIWLLGNNFGVYKNQYNLSKADCFSFVKLKELQKYDIVILHSLELYWYFFVYFSKKIRFIWIGWGFDYYDLIKLESPIVLELTKKNKPINQLNSEFIKSKIFKLFKFIFKKKIIRKIEGFAPVLKVEYDLIKKSNNIKPFPQYIDWNYGSVERNFIKGYENYKVLGESILIGNSATETNNHFEVIDILKNINGNKKYIFPLSYGDRKYKDAVIKKGIESLGDNFYPINDFIEYNKYVELLIECKSVIMNHVRQQGLGNIFIALYFGSRVFLRKENPIYSTFIEYGFLINSIDDIINDVAILDKGLTDSEIQYNRNLLIKHWGENIMKSKTKKII